MRQSGRKLLHPKVLRSLEFFFVSRTITSYIYNQGIWRKSHTQHYDTPFTLSVLTLLPGKTSRAECEVPILENGREESVVLTDCAVCGLGLSENVFARDGVIRSCAFAHPCIGGRMESSGDMPAQGKKKQRGRAYDATRPFLSLPVPWLAQLGGPLRGRPPPTDCPPPVWLCSLSTQCWLDPAETIIWEHGRRG
jgi:hypothetical protein